MPKTLSNYFPPDTAYFYGYPASKKSGFLNLAPTQSEELVSARTLVCAGDSVQAITFARAIREETLRLLRDEIGLPMVGRDRIIALPDTIDDQVTGDERDRLVQKALSGCLRDGQLVMAQPYSNGVLDDKYQIPASITGRLNDKGNLSDLVPAEFLAEIYQSFANGQELACYSSSEAPLPCVVKVENSSAGDGVRVCKTRAHFEAAQEDFKGVATVVVIQEYIEDAQDVDIQFGVPADSDAPADILGFSTQITTSMGEYLSGVFDDSKKDERIDEINGVVRDFVIPRARAMGWYGVGGVDALVRRNGRFVIIDPNFRMTATHAYRMQMEAGLVKTPFVSMSGRFEGGLGAFQRDIVPLARLSEGDRILHPIALSEQNGVVRFNAALLYDQPESLKGNAADLLSLGIKADLLNVLIQQ